MTTIFTLRVQCSIPAIISLMLEAIKFHSMQTYTIPLKNKKQRPPLTYNKMVYYYYVMKWFIYVEKGDPMFQEMPEQVS